jgi:hypothetical protein
LHPCRTPATVPGSSATATGRPVVPISGAYAGYWQVMRHSDAASDRNTQLLANTQSQSLALGGIYHCNNFLYRRDGYVCNRNLWSVPSLWLLRRRRMEAASDTCKSLALSNDIRSCFISFTNRCPVRPSLRQASRKCRITSRCCGRVRVGLGKGDIHLCCSPAGYRYAIDWEKVTSTFVAVRQDIAML